MTTGIFPYTPVIREGTQRLEQFSDGVFSIVITLLVLQFTVPKLDPGQIDAALEAELLLLLPRVATYVVSFLLIGIYWVAHHNLFVLIVRLDRRLLWLNLLLLMLVAFLPYPTAVLGAYPGSRVAVMLYGGSLILSSMAMQLLWHYASSGHRLLDPHTPIELIRMAAAKIGMSSILNTLGLCLSMISLPLGLCLYAIIPLLYIFPSKLDSHYLGIMEARLAAESAAAANPQVR